MSRNICIHGLTQNNLKNISLEIPENQIVVFTGLSGSGKSSVVFDTIATESQRQMNQTYPAFVRGRLPKHEKPQVQMIENLRPSVIVDQSNLGGNNRSTVGTISDIYGSLRLLFSRFGSPSPGPASSFSFNDPSGMCKTCSGLGKVMDIDLSKVLDPSKSLAEGCLTDSRFKKGSWYLKKYLSCKAFDPDKKLCDYSKEEYEAFLYGREDIDPIIGVFNLYHRLCLNRDISTVREKQQEKITSILTEKECPDCHGKRLNRRALSVWIEGYNINDFCCMELLQLRHVLKSLNLPRATALINSIVESLSRLIDIGLGYLHLNRESLSLSGGEAQRLKLVRYMGSSLIGLLYIFDEPSTGMHPRDVFRLNNLLENLRDRGNSVLVVEHDKDVISIADTVIDMGPKAGALGGEVVYQGTYQGLLEGSTLTSNAMRRNIGLKVDLKKPTAFLPIRNACIHNLKNVNVDIPLGVLTVITGVAGSGKTSLVKVFADTYSESIVHINQGPITATNRSNAATYLEFFDEIRKLFAQENHVSESLLSYNSLGACPACKGKGFIVTELAFMDPITTTCELCSGERYSKEALECKYQSLSIVEALSLTANQALRVFPQPKIHKALESLCKVGLGYLTLGQSLSTLSGGERQRIKLAKNLKSTKKSIYILDEPTTGLHGCDCEALMALFESFVDRGDSVIIIEHNLDVIKRADFIIDVGPDGGKNGGQIVFFGTPKEMVESSETITAKCLRANLQNKSLSRQEQLELSLLSEEISQSTEEDGMKVNAIGRIENSDEDCRIVLNKECALALKGLEGFSHVQVIWWFDGCDTKEARSIMINDKPYKNGPEQMGTFATRSPARPNPIAVTTSQITYLDIENAIIGLGFLDALDGTPVLDIKPYTPSLDRVEHPQVPSWCANWPKNLEESGDFDWSQVFNFKS